MWTWALWSATPMKQIKWFQDLHPALTIASTFYAYNSMMKFFLVHPLSQPVSRTQRAVSRTIANTNTTQRLRLPSHTRPTMVLHVQQENPSVLLENTSFQTSFLYLAEGYAYGYVMLMKGSVFIKTMWLPTQLKVKHFILIQNNSIEDELITQFEGHEAPGVCRITKPLPYAIFLMDISLTLAYWANLSTGMLSHGYFCCHMVCFFCCWLLVSTADHRSVALLQHHISLSVVSSSSLAALESHDWLLLD